MTFVVLLLGCILLFNVADLSRSKVLYYSSNATTWAPVAIVIISLLGALWYLFLLGDVKNLSATLVGIISIAVVTVVLLGILHRSECPGLLDGGGCHCGLVVVRGWVWVVSVGGVVCWCGWFWFWVGVGVWGGPGSANGPNNT